MVVVAQTRVWALEAEGARMRGEVGQLRAENGELRATNAVLETRGMGTVTFGANLQAQLNELAAHLGANWQNSSKPPSSDRTGDRPRWRGKAKEQSLGGQKGPKATQRSPVPADQVTASETLEPPNCWACGAKLDGDNPKPVIIHQDIDIPRHALSVAQYKLHRLQCSCPVTTCAALPTGVSPSQLGHRLLALVATGAGTFRLSKRTVVAHLELIYGLNIDVGTVCGIVHQESQRSSPCRWGTSRRMRSRAGASAADGRGCVGGGRGVPSAA
jgi:hypothetical protein